MAEIVSRRYAKALFDICIEENSISLVKQQVQEIMNVYNTEEDFKTVMNHPHITGDEKFSLIKNSFGDNLSDTVYGFFSVVFSKNREIYIYDILTAYLEYVDEYLGVSVATVTSAVPLSVDKVLRLKETLSNKFKKDITVVTVVDKSIIGGIIINIDGYMIDSSIKNSLKNLSKSLETL